MLFCEGVDGGTGEWKMVFLMKKCNYTHSMSAEKDMTKLPLFFCQTEMHLAGQKTR